MYYTILLYEFFKSLFVISMIHLVVYIYSFKVLRVGEWMRERVDDFLDSLQNEEI